MGSEYDKGLPAADNTFASEIQPLLINTLAAGHLASLNAMQPELKLTAASTSAEIASIYDELIEILESFKIDPMSPDTTLIKQQLLAYTDSAFDSAYISWQISEHQKIISVFENRIADNEETLLRRFALNHISMLTLQLEEFKNVLAL